VEAEVPAADAPAAEEAAPRVSRNSLNSDIMRSTISN